MSMKDILREAVAKNPTALKEALAAEMHERVRKAISEKIAEETAHEEEDDGQEEDDLQDSMKSEKNK